MHDKCNTLTVRCMPSNISGAIHPLVPVTPDRCENDRRPVANFLHRPKSEIIARTCRWRESGRDNSTLCGFMSLCTIHTHATLIAGELALANISLLILIMTRKVCVAGCSSRWLTNESVTEEPHPPLTRDTVNTCNRHMSVKHQSIWIRMQNSQTYSVHQKILVNSETLYHGRFFWVKESKNMKVKIWQQSVVTLQSSCKKIIFHFYACEKTKEVRWCHKFCHL